jgi:hypothetical protein
MKPKKPAKVAMPTKSTAKTMRDQFWAKDSANLADAAKTFKSMSERFGDAPISSIAGSVGDKYMAAKDSINAISKRRANDKEFFNKMSK